MGENDSGSVPEIGHIDGDDVGSGPTTSTSSGQALRLSSGQVAGTELPEPPRKRRGRPRSDATGSSEAGIGTRKKREKVGVSEKKLSRQIAGIHQAIALFTHSPIWQITDTEAEALGGAVSDVMSLYDVTISPHVVAWMNLAACCATIYGPRIAASVYLAKQSKPKQSPIIKPSPITEIDGIPISSGLNIG